jgi:ABC-type sugar transport system ATPase subunit
VNVKDAPPGIEVTVDAVEPLGAENILKVNAGGVGMFVKVQSIRRYKYGDRIWIEPLLDRIYIFDEKGEAIYP